MSKYHAKKTEVDGILFASQKEARRYQELRLMEKAGEIRGLCLQVEYPLDVFSALKHQEVRIGKYVADFQYQERDIARDEWRLVTEDTKGFKTPIYRWKCKHMAAQYGITIRET